MTSIFDIEKRLPLRKECSRLNEFIKKNRFHIRNDNDFYDLYGIIDEFIFIKWGYRHTSTCLDEYLDYFNIDFNYFKEHNIVLSDEKYLYYLETMVNLIQIVDKDLKNQNAFIVNYAETDKMNEFIITLKINIELILEANNLKIYIVNPNMIRFTKRDADADTAIIILNDRDISLDILSFLDFRNENNINEKKSIISRLYKHLESNQSSYKNIRIKPDNNSKDINPLDDFFMLANKFDIRHHPKELEKNGTIQNLDERRTLEVLDICFRLFLRIVNTSEAISDQDYINNLKSEFNLK